MAKSVLSAIAEVGVMAFGGYNRAERSRLVIYPQFFLTEAIRSPIRVLQARGNLNFVEVKHGNYLGALVGLGLKREKLGDIICLADGCQVVAAAEVADYILSIGDTYTRCLWRYGRLIRNRWLLSQSGSGRLSYSGFDAA